METLTPITSLEPEETETASAKAPVPFIPIARAVIGAAVELAVDFGREVIQPELNPQHQQQVRHPVRNQQELLLAAMEIAYLQAEADLLEAQSPGHIMQSFFGTPEEIRADIEKMTAVRTELTEIASAPPQTPAVEVQYTPQTVSTMDAGNL